MCESPWHLLGVGSLGTLLSARLAQQQMACELLLRNQQHLTEYHRQSGLHVTGATEINGVKPLARAPCHSFTIEKLIVTTKAHDTLNALSAWSNHLSDSATLVILQNGMGVADPIQTLFPNAKVVLATTTEGAYRKSAFNVHHAGRGSTWLGPKTNHTTNIQDHQTLETNNNPPSPIVNTLINALNDSGFKSAWDPNISQRLWHKLAINCSINGLATLHNVRNGELLETASFQRQFDELIEEICALYRIIHPTLAISLKKDCYETVQKTSENVCSTLQDVRSHKPTELRYLNGFLIDYATRFQIDLVKHRHLLLALKAKHIQ